MEIFTVKQWMVALRDKVYTVEAFQHNEDVNDKTVRVSRYDGITEQVIINHDWHNRGVLLDLVRDKFKDISDEEVETLTDNICQKTSWNHGCTTITDTLQ